MSEENWRRRWEEDTATAQPGSDYIIALQDLKQGLRKRKLPESSSVYSHRTNTALALSHPGEEKTAIQSFVIVLFTTAA